MAEEGLKIKIGADVVQVVQSLNQLQTEFNDLNTKIKNAVPGTSQFNELAKQLAFTEAKIKGVNTAAGQAGSALKNNFTGASNQASTALTNFSRVASDAPFGLIGIANNIDPLVQSFIQLRKETGSGKAALTALATSLAGGGGLILGVSLLTSALQFAQLGFSRWGASASKAKEETDKLTQAQQDFVRDISKQRLEIDSLVKSANNLTLSEKDRANAIDRLNKIIPDNIGLINEQNVATEEGAAIIRNYITAVEARATAEILSGRIAENNVKIFDAQNKLKEETNRLQNQILKNEKQAAELAAKGTASAQSYLGLSQSTERSQKQLLDLQKEQNQIINESNKANETLRKQYESLIPTVNTLSVTNEKSQKQSKENTNEIIDLLKRYNEELKGINWEEQNRQIDGTKKRLELAGETLKNLYLAGVKETSAAWIQVKIDFNSFQTDYDKFVRDQRLAEINNQVKEYTQNIGSYSEKVLAGSQKRTVKALQDVGKLFLANYELQQKQLTELQKKNEELANTISGFLTPALDGVFESLVRGEDPFEALGNSVRQLVIELGKAVIKSLILRAVTAAIGGPAAGGLGAQIGGLGTVRGDALSFFLSRGR